MKSSLRFGKSVLFASLCAAVFSGAATELEAGYWQFWKTPLASPVGQPSSAFCLTAEEAKNPIGLVGDVPGDSSCEVKNLQKTSDSASNFDLVCNNGQETFKASTVKMSNRFVTAKVAVGTFEKTYTHGVRVEAACTK